ncbi:MAG: efflux RND transporter periplasmic adaptor subunit [Chloroflexia bacterium]
MKKSNTTRRNVIIALGVVVLAVVALFVWRGLGTRGGADSRTATVRRGSLTATIETSGRLAARRVVSVTTPASGTIKIVAVSEGEAVRQGDVLVVLDDAQMRAAVTNAEKAVETAETRVGVARQRAATDDKALPDLAAAQNDADTARTALVAAQERLAATLVLAPFDGVVAAVRVGEGNGFGGGEVAVLADPTDLYVTADLDEIDRPLVSEGQEVTLTATPFSSTELKGKIAVLSATSQSRGGSTVYPVQITFTRPADKPLALLPGMTVDVRIVTNARENVLIVPSNAVRRAGERQYATVKRDGKEVDVEVRTGTRAGGDVEITEGLTEGEVVVLR